ncbi:unnamed protein product [Urochloa decumbens]|uniref:Uncharacterized protein n=1 Tax=Urochloa decumbens TaxID=240449 RepID=A0ABC9D8W0_9POAL
MEWVVKFENDLTDCAKHIGKYSMQMDGAWRVKEKHTRDVTKHMAIDSSEWDSDNDNIFEVNHDVHFYAQHFSILGFHPRKEVVFLAESFGAVAYHLDSSKVQYLGDAGPKCYYHSHWNGVYESFVYTPRLMYGGNTANFED